MVVVALSACWEPKLKKTEETPSSKPKTNVKTEQTVNALSTEGLDKNELSD